MAAVRWKVFDNCTFPIDAGQFYANFVLKNLSPGQRIDMKKTKYKKFSTFLRSFNDELIGEGSDDWIVKVISKKGIDSIEKVLLFLNFLRFKFCIFMFLFFSSTLIILQLKMLSFLFWTQNWIQLIFHH